MYIAVALYIWLYYNVYDKFTQIIADILNCCRQREKVRATSFKVDQSCFKECVADHVWLVKHIHL